MLIEFLLALILSGIILYLFYIYLEWCDKYAWARDAYQSNPMFVPQAEKDVVEKYGTVILPTYLSDTYKPIRFWILYYRARYF
jgi:hypothetical protein